MSKPEASSKHSHAKNTNVDQEDHHVHFPEDADGSTESHLITVQMIDQHKYTVHLGLLQYCHRYQITFDLPFATKDIPEGYSEKPMIPRSNFRLIEAVQKNHCVGLVLEYLPCREHLLKDEYNVDIFGHCLSLTLVSRVLGPGKGTPSLRSGLKLIANELDNESDSSDWKGFD